jgi:excisionase family DNA binding protein
MTEEYDDSLVGIPEACSTLGISRSTVFRLIRRGSLQSIRKGGRRLVRKQALLQGGVRHAEQRLPPLTRDHPIFRLSGAGRGGGRTPGARDKHAILDE